MTTRPTDNLHAGRDSARGRRTGKRGKHAVEFLDSETQTVNDESDARFPTTARPLESPSGPNPMKVPTSLVRDLVRDEVVLSARTWVVKVGTSVLTGPDGTLDPARIDHLAEQISTVMDRGCKVALVSSGAVGAGWDSLDGSAGLIICLSSKPPPRLARPT